MTEVLLESVGKIEYDKIQVEKHPVIGSADKRKDC